LEANDGFFVKEALTFADYKPADWKAAFVGCDESGSVRGGRELETAR
jgi:hypothetical protein